MSSLSYFFCPTSTESESESETLELKRLAYDPIPYYKILNHLSSIH